jgi:pimeloyl-ACP methyl ester carboxylesterase
MEDAYLNINHSNQFISIRGKNVKDNPVLLFLHGGPGASATALFQRFNQDLEENFTVVCWDQRGAGKSFSNSLDKATLTVPQIIDDAHVLISYLCQRFGKEKIFLLGHSWGSRLGMYLVKAYPEKIEGFIGVGQEVSAFEGELQSWQYTYQKAIDTKNQPAIKELEEMGAPQNGSYLTMYKTGFWGMVKQKEWLLKLGGERYERTNYNDWVSKMWLGYNGNVFQLVKWSKASASTAGTMFHDPAFNNFDLRTDIASVSVPVHFASGSSDYNTPWPLVKQYASMIEAPEKSFTLFDKSGHSPLFEESDKFNAFVIRTFLKR